MSINFDWSVGLCALERVVVYVQGVFWVAMTQTLGLRTSATVLFVARLGGLEGG